MLKKYLTPQIFKLDRPLRKGKKLKLIGLMKDELGGKIMKEYVGSRPKHIAI